MHLIDLEGCAAKETPCEFFKKPSELKGIFEKKLAATSADYNGAINVYIDDNGKYRCEAMKNLSSVEKQVYNTIDEAEAWSKKWLRKIK